MVIQLLGAPAPVYRVHDDDGKPIGDVTDPRDFQIIGRGSGTVLLRRSERR